MALVDCGYSATASPLALRETLSAAGRGARTYNYVPLSEPEVAKMLVAMGVSSAISAQQVVAGAPRPPSPVQAFGLVLDSLAVAAGRPVIFSVGRATNQSSNTGSLDWRHDVVAVVLREDHAHLDWARVVSALDFPECSFTSGAAFQFVVNVTLNCTSAGFPTFELLRRPWANARAHIDALRHAISAPIEAISFAPQDPNKIIPAVGSPPGTVVGPMNQCFMNQDLYSLVLRLSQTGGPDVALTAAAILDAAQSQVPEILLLAMARSKVIDACDSDPAMLDPVPLRAKVFGTQLGGVLGNLIVMPGPGTPAVLQLQRGVLIRMWEISRPLTATALLNLAKVLANRAVGEHEQLCENFNYIGRIVERCGMLSNFPNVALMAPAPHLSMEVAIYFAMAGPELEARIASELSPMFLAEVANASGVIQKAFRLDAWLQWGLVEDSALASRGLDRSERFVVACIGFIKRIVASQSHVLLACRTRTGAPVDGSAAEGSPNQNATSPILVAAEAAAQDAAARESVVRSDVLVTVLKRLRSYHASNVAAAIKTSSAFNMVYEAACRVFPLLNALVDQDIEENANMLFKKIYTSQMSVVDFVELMRRFKSSTDARERDVFACMVQSLFKEFQYFHKYPDKELQITGKLFGMLIQNNLISTPQALKQALQNVLEAIKKPPPPIGSKANGNLYRFGVYALEQFKSRLPGWPIFCSQISRIPHLRQQYPQFVAEIDALQIAQAQQLDLKGGGSSGGDLNNETEPLLEGTSGNIMHGGVSGSGGGGGGILSSVDALHQHPLQHHTSGGGRGGGGGGGIDSGAGDHSQHQMHSNDSSSSRGGGGSNDGASGNNNPSSLTSRISNLGADLTEALAALSAGQPIPAILPSAAAAAAAAKEAEERASAAASSGGAGGGDGGASSGSSDSNGPPSSVADRVTFLVNNMTESNVDAEAAEAVSILSPHHRAWLASYLVTKRVANQPNFQPLYKAFVERFASREVERFGDSELEKAVLSITLECAKRYLASEKIKTSTTERSTLKNIGAWLGLITLSRSKPLLHKDLNMKELLWEAYETGKLFPVVGFIVNVLKCTAVSTVFRPPNPWTVAALSALRELYDVDDIKLNLKFEVEVLCEHLKIKLQDVPPSRHLHLRKRPDLTDNTDFNNKANPESIPGIPPRSEGAMSPQSTSAAPPGGSPLIPGLLSLITLRSFAPIFHPSRQALAAAAAAAAAATATGRDAVAVAAAAASAAALAAAEQAARASSVDAASVSGGGDGGGGGGVESSLGEDTGASSDVPHSAKANLRNVVAVSLDRAVRENIQGIVERSVTIAKLTTVELISKDFALEPDADRMSRAAHMLVTDLAGSHAVISGQDNLKIAIGAALRNNLNLFPTVITSMPVDLSHLGDAAINLMLQGVVNENLEVACALVEKAAVEKAIKAIDEALEKQIESRRKSGGTYIDTSAYMSGSRWPAALPEALRPRASGAHLGPTPGLSPQQLRVYESFGRGEHAAQDRIQFQQAHQQLQQQQQQQQQQHPHAPSGVIETVSAVASSPLVGIAALTPANGPPIPPAVAIDAFNMAFERLLGAIRNLAQQVSANQPNATGSMVDANTISRLPPDHELVLSLRELRAIGLRIPPPPSADANANFSGSRDQICVVQSQRLFKGLLELPSPATTLLDALALHSYVAALLQLRDMTRQLKKDLVQYFPLMPEDRRFSSEGIVLALLRAGLLHVGDFDRYLAGPQGGGSANNANTAFLLTGPLQPSLRFAMVVVHLAVVREKIIFPNELSLTIDMLLAIAQRGQQLLQPGAQPQSGTPLATLLSVIDGVRGVVTERQRAAAAANQGHHGPHGAHVPVVAVSVTSTVGAPMILGAPPPSQAAVASAAATVSQLASADSYPDDYRSKILFLLEMWVQISEQAAVGQATDRQFQQYLLLLANSGHLSSDSATERFLRAMMEVCVRSCAALAKPYPDGQSVSASELSVRNSAVVTAPVPTPKLRLSYKGVDSLSKLIVLLVKVTDGEAAKISSLQRLLVIFAKTLLRDADINGGGCTPELSLAERASPDATFDQRCYFRLFSNLMRDLHVPSSSANLSTVTPPSAITQPGTLPLPTHAAPSPADEANENARTHFNAQVLAIFAGVFHLLRPERVPGFAFSWLLLISHRLFMPALLAVPGQRGWPHVHKLLVDLFRFLYPYLRRGELVDGLRLYYKGTLRLLLVLLHDSPEFLADYHWTLMETIPLTCVQLRNLVLAAAPSRLYRLPDPFKETSPEALSESGFVPRVLGSVADALPHSARAELETYLRAHRGPGVQPPPTAILLSTVKQALLSDAEMAATTLNRISLRAVHSLVLFLVMRAINGEAGQKVDTAAVCAAASSSPSAELLRALIVDLDGETRFALLNSVVCQLRYPNAHTLFCMRFVLGLFSDPPTANGASPQAIGAQKSVIREQVARVLMERIIVHRPHPWGVLATLTELVRLPGYGLFQQAFVRTSPDIERLFESVARSCNGGLIPAHAQQQSNQQQQQHGQRSNSVMADPASRGTSSPLSVSTSDTDPRA